MKTKNYGSLCLLAATLVVVGMTFNSCKDDEESPIPEIVENPLEKETYFITGMVTDGTNALADVTVTTGTLSATTDATGAYLLEVNKKGSFEVNFAKDGYLTIKNDVTIDTKAGKGTIVSCSQVLTKKAEPVKVDPSKESKVNPNEELDVTIPAGAVEKETEITMTSFVPAADTKSKEAAEKVTSSGSSTPVTVSTAMSLASLNCEPDGLKFEKPVEVKLKASEAAGGVYFTKARHYVNGVDNGEAAYETASHSYVIMLDGFSVHEVKVDADLSVSASSENCYSKVIDNIGKTTPVSEKISFKVKQGWQIKSKTAGVTGDVEAKLMTALMNTLSSSAGVSETEVNREVAVSGDMKMSVSYDQAVVSYTFQVETSAGTESIVAESYGPVSQNISKENGNMIPQHN